MKFCEEPRDITEAAEVLSPSQQTLIIGGWTSVCGKCGGNADLSEPSHEMKNMAGGPGCGVEWKFVTTDGIDKSAAETLRPDLEWVEQDYSNDGVTIENEVKMIGGLSIIGPVRLEEFEQ